MIDGSDPLDLNLKRLRRACLGDAQETRPLEVAETHVQETPLHTAERNVLGMLLRKLWLRP
jgi:hypothetical protein